MTVSEGSTMMNDAWKAMVASVAVGVAWAVVAEVGAVTLTATVAASALVCDPLTKGRAMGLTTATHSISPHLRSSPCCFPSCEAHCPPFCQWVAHQSAGCHCGGQSHGAHLGHPFPHDHHGPCHATAT